MDEVIELSFDLAILVSRYLNTNKVVSANKEFTKCYTREELLKVKSLVITNPKRNSLSKISNLSNLEELTINTIGVGDVTTITDDDIRCISKLKKLTKLKIVNQNGITNIDLSNLANLKELLIDSNNKLTKIDGIDNLKEMISLTISNNKSLKHLTKLDKLTKLEILSIYGNNIFKIDKLNEVIKNNKLQKVVLDVIFISDTLGDNNNIDMESLTKMNGITSFVEYSNNIIKRMDVGEAFKFHERCLSIIYDKSIVSSIINYDDEINRIIDVESYISRNVLYSDTNLSPSYSAIMHNKTTSEGYSNATRYLLKQLGIKTHPILCKKEKIHIPGTQSLLPDDGLHSVLLIDDIKLYLDPCWDAAMYQSGANNYLPFTLLNQSEISKTHSLTVRDPIDPSMRISREEITKHLRNIEEKHI